MLRATIVALVLVTAGSAWAAEGRLAVVELQTPPNMSGLGGQLTQLLLKNAQQQGYHVIPPERIRQTLDQKAYVQLQECNGQPACVANRLADVPADRAVVGSLNRDEKSYLLRLFLIDLQAREVISTVERSILIASRRLIPDASEAIPPLLKGEREAKGTLKVTTNVAEAAVTVNGEPAGVAPVTLQLKPGKHTVRLEKRSYLPVERLVTVEANQTAEEEFRLLLAPGERPPEELEPRVAKAPAAAPQDSGALRVPAVAWAGYVAALGAGGGAIYFGSRAQRADALLKSNYDANAGVYHQPRTLALEGRRDALVANVLFGVAGVALGTAVTFTILENTQPAPVQVTPAPTPGGAALLFHGRF